MGSHVAIVALSAENAYLKAQLTRAAKLGVSDRVHVVSYVPHWQVVDFLRTADIGVIPIHRWKNHEISLITKFFEYSHARLPIVVSDVKTMAEAARATGQGEVFRAQDVGDYVRAVQTVLADPGRYRAAYDRSRTAGEADLAVPGSGAGRDLQWSGVRVEPSGCS